VKALLRDRLGHSALSIQEDIPPHRKALSMGAGAHGGLPITPAVYEVDKEAKRPDPGWGQRLMPT
jgi:hypothetical protein